MKITIAKNAKAFVLAVKAIATFTKRAAMRVSLNDGIRIEVMSDNRTGYHILRVHASDIIMESNVLDDLVFGLDMKAFVHTLRNITTLTDALVIEFPESSGVCKVTTKTKHEEACHTLTSESFDEQLLEIPYDIPCVLNMELVTRELDDATKRCGNYVVFELEEDQMVCRGLQRSVENTTFIPYTNKVKPPAKKIKQMFQTQILHNYIKPTMSKKMVMMINDAYPLCIQYVLYKKSCLSMYLAECKA